MPSKARVSGYYIYQTKEVIPDHYYGFIRQKNYRLEFGNGMTTEKLRLELGKWRLKTAILIKA
jgi:hypothetical protein